MSKNIKFVSSSNPAKNFALILKDLRDISLEENRPIQEVIRDFISDLQNSFDANYERKILNFKIIGGIPEKLMYECISYLNKAIKVNEKQEQNNLKRKKQQEKKKAKEEKEQEMKNILNGIEESIDIATCKERTIKSRSYK